MMLVSIWQAAIVGCPSLYSGWRVCAVLAADRQVGWRAQVGQLCNGSQQQLILVT